MILIRLNVAPVIAVHIPFGGDNHADPGLANETSQTVSAVAAIASLMSNLESAGLQDRVTLMTLNVFANLNETIGEDIGRKICERHGFLFELEKRERGAGAIHAR